MNLSTSLPWHVGMKPGPIVYGPKGEQIADFRAESAMVAPDEARANALAIVQAVNGYAAAIEALRGLSAMVRNVLTDSQLDRPQLGGARALCARTIREALAPVDAILAECATPEPPAAPLSLVPGSYRVRATRDLTVGPQREIAVAKGAIRTVNVDAAGRFSTFTDGFSFFGVCRIGDGWEVA